MNVYYPRRHTTTDLQESDKPSEMDRVRVPPSQVLVLQLLRAHQSSWLEAQFVVKSSLTTTVQTTHAALRLTIREQLHPPSNQLIWHATSCGNLITDSAAATWGITKAGGCSFSPMRTSHFMAAACGAHESQNTRTKKMTKVHSLATDCSYKRAIIRDVWQAQ